MDAIVGRYLKDAHRHIASCDQSYAKKRTTSPLWEEVRIKRALGLHEGCACLAVWHSFPRNVGSWDKSDHDQGFGIEIPTDRYGEQHEYLPT